jgi:GNAT superfamily N-acetyltransferase
MIRGAQANERELLGELAYRAKQHWGYDASFMARCRDELAVDPRAIAEGRCRVLELERAVVGYYALSEPARHRVELDALFIEPGAMGQGHGRRLYEDAVRLALRLDCTHLEIQSDPHALGFYLAMGARELGVRASASVPNRWLPMLEATLDSERCASTTNV